MVIRYENALGRATGTKLIATFSLLFALIVGIGGSLLSLLLRWPGLDGSSPAWRLAAEAHVPILAFFAVLPGAICGLGLRSTMVGVGAQRTALPFGAVAGWGLNIGAMFIFAGSLFTSGHVAGIACAHVIALSTVLLGADLVATFLCQRTIAYADLPFSAWTNLLAAAIAVCVAPIAAARYTALVQQDVSPRVAMDGTILPILAIALVQMIGVVDDVTRELCSNEARPRPWSVVLLAGGVLSLFLAWAGASLDHFPGTVTPRSLEFVFLLVILPMEIEWARRFFSKAIPSAGYPSAVLFAAGFALVLPAGLALSLYGVGGHEVISLAIVFALFAGVHEVLGNDGANGERVLLPRIQFYCLLLGSIDLLCPLPGWLKPLGAALLALSVGLLVARLVTRAWQLIRGDELLSTRRDTDLLFSERMP